VVVFKTRLYVSCYRLLNVGLAWRFRGEMVLRREKAGDIPWLFRFLVFFFGCLLCLWVDSLGG